MLTPETTHLSDRKGFLKRACYRAEQFFQALTAYVHPEELEIVRDYLPPVGVFLFLSMPRQDQRHSLDVLYSLQQNGFDNPDLLAAALLHDVGKAEGGRLRLWHRIIIVLLRATRPDWLVWLGSGTAFYPGSWRHPFYIHLNHPARSALLAESVGCSPLTVELIQRHQDPLPPEADRSAIEKLLAAFQIADDKH